MIRLILLVLFVLVVLAFRFLDWWMLLILGAAVILLGNFFAKKLFLWIFSMPFRAKGRVLRNATVEIHSIHPAAPPVKNRGAAQARLPTEEEDDDEEDDEDEPDVVRDYYEIEVTITPQPQPGPFQHWDYGEVTLANPGKRWDVDDDTCRVANVELVRTGTVLLDSRRLDDDDEDDGPKVAGPHRLRMLIGVKGGIRELVFSYYFEKFGKVSLVSP
jgi:uncharacterized protein (DUF58 family)